MDCKGGSVSTAVDIGMSSPMPGRRPTAYDVARLAGVSQSMISRAFTPGGSVSPEVRAKVLEAARQLNYRPNLIARSLITQRSRLIGVTMADTSERSEQPATAIPFRIHDEPPCFLPKPSFFEMEDLAAE